MSEEEKKPLFRKGMKVTCVRRGDGVVEDIIEGAVFPVFVRFGEDDTDVYTDCGKLLTCDPKPILYPGAVEITVKPFAPDYELDQPIWGWRGEGYNVVPYHVSRVDDDGNVFAWVGGKTSHTSLTKSEIKLAAHGLTEEEVKW